MILWRPPPHLLLSGSGHFDPSRNVYYVTRDANIQQINQSLDQLEMRNTSLNYISIKSPDLCYIGDPEKNTEEFGLPIGRPSDASLNSSKPWSQTSRPDSASATRPKNGKKTRRKMEAENIESNRGNPLQIGFNPALNRHHKVR